MKTSYIYWEISMTKDFASAKMLWQGPILHLGREKLRERGCFIRAVFAASEINTSAAIFLWDSVGGHIKIFVDCGCRIVLQRLPDGLIYRMNKMAA